MPSVESFCSLLAVRIFSSIALIFLSFGAWAQETALDFSAEIKEGVVISVIWTGPNGSGDFLAIALPETAAADFLGYVRTSQGSPVEFEPLTVGDYELRYIRAADLSILARKPLRIVPASAALVISAPKVATAGAQIEIEVSDPGQPADYVTIVAVGSPDDAFGTYARLRGKNKVTLDAPKEAGPYEIRQIRASGQIVLSRRALSVEPPAPQVELMALEAVDGANQFGIALSQPVTVQARLVIAIEGGDALGDGWAVGPGRIQRVTAPIDAGIYEIRLLDEKSGGVIASRPLEVR